MSARCCMCGVAMPPNAANTCLVCLKSKVDITEGIMKQGIVSYCRGCERFNGPPWMKYELESSALLTMLLKKIKGLKQVKLIDAKWIWTEAHSKRLKLELTV